ncbi:MAG TPA: T9SS type A sorting domain-containing protein [Bacteroidales bacterium]|nr:T9SS type A sorting domain-containing protein [Bacteroidales bacterium]
MKHLFTIILIAITMAGFAQIPTDSLSCWLSSDMGVVANMNNVQQWDDRSGHMRNAITTYGNPQLIPNEICGNPVIRFNGTSNGMTLPPFESFSNMRGAIIVVGRINGPGNGAAGYGTFVSTWVGSGVAWQFAANLNTYSWFDGVGGSVSPITASPPNQWGILSLNRRYDDTLQFYKSGILVQNKVIANIQPTLNSIKIGYSGSFEVLNGDIAEIIIYNKSLSDAEIYQVNTYLANKYCFNSSVPQPTASSQTSCGPSSFILSASGGIHYRWYSDLNSTTPLSTDAYYTTPLLTSSDTVYVANYNDTLESARTIVTATIFPLPIVTLALNPDTVCLNSGAFNLTGGSPLGGIYSGAGVSAGNFDPNNAGVGLHDMMYTYSDTNYCTNSDTTQIYVDLCTGHESVSDKQSVLIYPSPTNGILFINSDHQFSNIEILNFLGEKVYGAALNATKAEINLSEMPGGIYFVRINSESESQIEKIIIQ